MNAERLLNVAKALRECTGPEDDFDMNTFVHGGCGTPACALGHYAARTDLQSFLHVVQVNAIDKYFCMRLVNDDLDLDFVETILDHFDIDNDQFHELFSCDGCGHARSRAAAAEYIERFVAERQAKP